MSGYPWLSITTFLPLAGAVLILAIGSERRARWIGLITTLTTLAVAAPLLWSFDKSSSALQFVESAGADLRGDGGYVIAPPSSHSSGRFYAWEGTLGFPETSPAEVPERIRELIARYHPTTARPIDRLLGEPSGVATQMGYSPKPETPGP